MTPADIQALLQWWLILLSIGVAFLPITFHVFGKFFDKGYAFSKLIGIAFTTYSVFILGVLHIVPFTKISTLLIAIILALIFFFVLPRKNGIMIILRKNWKIFIFEEILFLGALFFWTHIRSFSPDIHGLEKYMDFGFINSILRSDFFPPKDMWLTPESINYYYFGHMVTAVLTKISSIPSSITFNLMLSTVFAFCLTFSFSLGANLHALMQKNEKFSYVKRLAAGFLTAALVTFAGNLHILYAFFKPYSVDKPIPLPFLDFRFKPKVPTLEFNPFDFPNSYWYPNATRFIYNTIHEFPIYSWVVADLHGHVLDIPFVLLTIAVLLSLFMTNAASNEGHNPATSLKKIPRGWEENIPYLFLIGFLLAVMYMTNAWDGGIYLLLASIVLFYIFYKRFKSFIFSTILVFLGLIFFSIPYSYFFKPFATGIGILCAPEFLVKIGKIGPLLFEANHCQHSPVWQLVILYGFFYFFVLSFVVFAIHAKRLAKSDIFVFILMILSTFLIILPEFIYLKDIYPAHYRANTMFKLVFQSHIMLSISSVYVLIRIVSSIKHHATSAKVKLFALLYLLIAICLISLVMLYPHLAINSYYGLDSKDQNNVKKQPIGLDGTLYLKNQYPSDYAAILWINKNIKGQPVILEAQGDSYTDFARVSSNTGLPTVLGWTVHEWLWRGSYDIPSPRISEIQTIYETTNLELAKQLLKKYKAEYVFVGALERQKYITLSEAKFEKLGKAVFSSQDTKLYKLSF